MRRTEDMRFGRDGVPRSSAVTRASPTGLRRGERTDATDNAVVDAGRSRLYIRKDEGAASPTQASGPFDRSEEAERQVEKVLADHPDASIKQELQRDFLSDEKREHWLEALRRAGLPE